VCRFGLDAMWAVTAPMPKPLSTAKKVSARGILVRTASGGGDRDAHRCRALVQHVRQADADAGREDMHSEAGYCAAESDDRGDGWHLVLGYVAAGRSKG
jgi:hypothetical protein